MKKNSLITFVAFGFVIFVLGILVGMQLNRSFDSKQMMSSEEDVYVPSDEDMETTTPEETEVDLDEEQLDETQIEESGSVKEENEEVDEEQGVLLTIENIREDLNLDKEYSKVSISPDGKKAAYIDFITFEALGNAYVYDSSTLSLSNITELTYEQPDTVKDILWLDNNSIALIIGYRNGTVTQGGSIYVYSYEAQKLRLVFVAEEKMEFTQLEWAGEDIRVKQVKWIDDNLTEYVYEELIFSVGSFK